jgi:hypothetical protein
MERVREPDSNHSYNAAKILAVVLATASYVVLRKNASAKQKRPSAPGGRLRGVGVMV